MAPRRAFQKGCCWRLLLSSWKRERCARGWLNLLGGRMAVLKSPMARQGARCCRARPIRGARAMLRGPRRDPALEVHGY
eukprot:5894963-Pyramimonas_sp.AAC.1